MASAGPGGGGPGGAGSTSSTSSGSGTGVGGGATSVAGGAFAPRAAGPSFMSRILGTKCHDVRVSPSTQLGRIGAKLFEAQEALAMWKNEKTADLSAFESRLNDLALSAGHVNVDSPTATRNLDAIQRDADELLREIRKQRPVVLPDGTELSGQVIPNWANLSNTQRRAAEVELEAKILRGGAIMNKLLDPSFDPSEGRGPTQQEISDLMFFLKVRAEKASGDQWVRGAMVIPDPGNKIRRWMDRTKGHVYTRDSSHLSKEDQGQRGGQGRGMDFNTDTLDRGLPYGQRTLLYQQLTRQGDGYLYIKQETEGARITMGALFRDDDAPDMKDVRPVNWGNDFGEAWRHGKNFVVGDPDKSGLARHAEKWGDQPSDVRTAYERLLAAVKTDPRLAPLAEQGVRRVGTFDALDRAKGAHVGDVKGIEVSQQQVNVNNVIAELQAGDHSGEVTAEVAAAIDAWRTAAAQAWGPDYEQKLPLRVGDEVLLERKDLV